MGTNISASHPPRSDGEATWRVAVPTLADADVLMWRRVFKGEARQLSEMRRWLASLLPSCPALDDVISVAVELGGNALAHTSSGHGGSFAVEVTRCEAAVRVAVADGGGTAEPHVIEDADAEHGRGLLLVRGLSVRTGVTGDRRGRQVWAEVAWSAAGAAAPQATGLGCAAAFHDRYIDPDIRFAGMSARLGRSSERCRMAGRLGLCWVAERMDWLRPGAHWVIVPGSGRTARGPRPRFTTRPDQAAGPRMTTVAGTTTSARAHACHGGAWPLTGLVLLEVGTL